MRFTETGFYMFGIRFPTNQTGPTINRCRKRNEKCMWTCEMTAN